MNKPIFGGNQDETISKPELEFPKDRVYVIERPDKCVKIGHSVHFETRKRTIETQGGFSATRFFASRAVSNGYEVEGTTHEKLCEYRGIGEWFSVPFEVAVDTVNETVLEIGGTEPRNARPITDVSEIVFDNITTLNMLEGYPVLIDIFSENGYVIRYREDCGAVVKSADFEVSHSFFCNMFQILYGAIGIKEINRSFARLSQVENTLKCHGYPELAYQTALNKSSAEVLAERPLPESVMKLITADKVLSADERERVECVAFTIGIQMSCDYYSYDDVKKMCARPFEKWDLETFRKMRNLVKQGYRISLEPPEESIRPYLTPDEAKMLDDLQRVDIGLLVAVQDFKERKAALIAYRDRRAALASRH